MQFYGNGIYVSFTDPVKVVMCETALARLSHGICESDNAEVRCFCVASLGVVRNSVGYYQLESVILFVIFVVTVCKNLCVICADEEEEPHRGPGRTEELEMQVNDHRDSEGQSIDDELEMQELLAALGEQERDSEGEEVTNTSNDLQAMRGGALTYSYVL